jgi:hypothetical protein
MSFSCCVVKFEIMHWIGYVDMLLMLNDDNCGDIAYKKSIRSFDESEKNNCKQECVANGSHSNIGNDGIIVINILLIIIGLVFGK